MRKAAETSRNRPSWECAGINLNEAHYITYRSHIDAF